MSRQDARIERHTIFPIPLSERHGRMRDLFTLWFGSNIMVLTIVTGALPTVLFKLPLLQAMGAILAGNLVGGIFMALHAAQGPQLGVPQMVQSRGQFGALGSLCVVAVVIFMYLGFAASALVLGGQSLHQLGDLIDIRGGMVVVALISLAATIYGHDLIHAYGRWMTWVCGGALLLCFAWIIGVTGLPADLLQRGSPSAGGFVGALSIGALWQIAYAPYVSDYTRYMPKDSGARQAFWASYWGCVLGSVLPMLLGALIGALIGEGDVIAGLVRLLGPAGPFVIVAFTLGLGATTAMQIYCGVLSIITIGQNAKPDWRPQAKSRAFLALLFTLISLAMALLGADNFLVNYANFINLLLCAMAPWTAINLVDYYVVRHGNYDVDSFFAVDGGIYGRYRGTALLCYGLGILAQLPFMSTELFTGPIATALGGADLSWIVGIGVVGPLYLAMTRLGKRTASPAV